MGFTHIHVSRGLWILPVAIHRARGHGADTVRGSWYYMQRLEPGASRIGAWGPTGATGASSDLTVESGPMVIVWQAFFAGSSRSRELRA